MAKFTKFILFGLPPDLFGLIRMEARRQNVSMSELVRKAIRHYISGSTLQRITTTYTDTMPMRTSSGFWTRTQQEYADSVMRQFREEDR